MRRDHTHVFLGGVHRSGTTFVARALAAHPAVSGLGSTGVPEDEGEHLQSVYPDSWELGHVGRFGFSARAHLTETSPLAGEASRRTLMEEWGPHWDLTRRFLLEKSPPNLLKLRFLQATFPDTRCIVVVRHPVAVTTAHLKWRPRVVRELSAHALVRHWVACHELLRADAPHVEHLLIVRYEDVVADPAMQFRRIFGFLGIGDDRTERSPVADHNAKYFESWRGGPSNVAKRAYIAAIEARYEARIRPFGYSFRQPELLGPLDLGA